MSGWPPEVAVCRLDGVLHATAGHWKHAYCSFAYTREQWQAIWRKMPKDVPLTCLWCLAHVLGKPWVRPWGRTLS